MGRARRVRDPLPVAADRDGNLFPVEGWRSLGRSGGTAVRPDPRSWVPLPEGSLLFHLPGRRPVAFDPRRARARVLPDTDGRRLLAAAAFLAPAWTALFLSPWERAPGAEPLPLFAYCAVGWDEDRGFVVPAIRVDPDPRQDPARFDEGAIARGAREMLRRFPRNRLAEHLVRNCALEYCCPAARNWVLGRHEAPLPTSPACNAACVGCISSQPGGRVPVTQPRLTFVPDPGEIAEIAADHLERVPGAVVSFGQGCEGEPLLQGEVLVEAVRRVRRRTARGTINLNTNASRPDVVARLVEAGLDSIRISLNSAREELYARYYRPRGYGLGDVLESGAIVARAGGLVSLNYFMFPGVTDTEEELAAFSSAVRRAGVRFVQMRNLNLDPDEYLAALGLPPDLPPGFGIDRWRRRARRLAPWLGFGYFNPPRERWPAPPPSPGAG